MKNKVTKRKNKFNLCYDHADGTTLTTFKAKYLDIINNLLLMCGSNESKNSYGLIGKMGPSRRNDTAYYWIPTNLKHVVETLNNEV